MGEFFQNKFRLASTRLNHWNYGWPGFYFVTICTKDRQGYLSEIRSGQVYMKEMGKIAFNCWVNIPKHFDNVELDDWIIMPNHLHGIIIIRTNDFGTDNCRDAPWHVSTVNKFAPLQPKSLSSIINHFKGAVKRQCNKSGLAFDWQERYYEHIIRDEDDYARIKKYIANNIINWSNDRNNPLNFNYEKGSLS